MFCANSTQAKTPPSKFSCPEPFIHPRKFFISKLYISYHEISLKMNTQQSPSSAMLNCPFIRIDSFYQNRELCSTQTHHKRRLRRTSSATPNAHIRAFKFILTKLKFHHSINFAKSAPSRRTAKLLTSCALLRRGSSERNPASRAAAHSLLFRK